ncbi:hypothetical protein ACV566_05475 [Staphylococcus aureus]
MPTKKAPKLLIKGDGNLKGSCSAAQKFRVYIYRK